jgi:hypothetical protein
LSSPERRGEEEMKMKTFKIIIVPLMDAIAVTSAILMSFIFPSSLMKYLMILDEFPAEFVEFIYFNCLMVALSTWALTSFFDDLKIRLRKFQGSSETGDEVRRR